MDTRGSRTPSALFPTLALLAACACAEQAAPAPDAGSPDAGRVEQDAGSAHDASTLDPPDAASPPDTGGEGCSGYSAATVAGALPAPLNETSGLAMSAAHPGVLFAHNDSGDTARFFALDIEGNLLGEFLLAGATAADWEDLAIGPCPTGSCVYLGDFGDNNRVRTDHSLYRVPLPEVDVGQSLGTVNVTWERLPFQYPSGTKWNAETLLVHPQTGEVYVLNKLPAGNASTVFRFPQPLTPEVQATLTQVAVLPVPTSSDAQLTGGDIHPCGDALLLRTYTRLYELRLPAGAVSFEEIFTTSDYRTVPVAVEPQGEAVTYQPSGSGYVTASEGRGAAINIYSCQ